MKRIGWFGGMLAAAGLATSAFAAEPNCKDPVSQSEMNQCAYMDFETADAALNAVYKKVREAMVETDKELVALDPKLKGAEAALVSGQRGWIAYRDGHCETVGMEAAGGSMQPLLVYGCKAELTQTRTRELEALIEGK